MTSARRLPLLWDVGQFAVPTWDGETTGVYQTVGQTVLQNGEVGLTVETESGPTAALGRLIVANAWESDVQGAAVAWFERGTERTPAIVEHDGAALLNFDFAKTVELMLFERHRVERRPFRTYLPVPYHRVVPRFVRRPLKRISCLLHGGVKPDRFPAWPWETGLLCLVSLCLPEPAPQHWPEGKEFALTLTHDVESAKGLRLAEDVAKAEADHGVRSTWFIVGRLASQARRLADRLKSDGHEIGLHGTHHDMAFPFLSRVEMEKRLDDCRAFVEDYGILGFRSPALLRTDLMYDVLGERFAYDSSAVDSGRVSPHPKPTGCGCIFPFRRGRLVVAPITLPLDSSLLFMGFEHDMMLNLWEDKVQFVADSGAAAVLATHPEPHFSGNDDGLRTYQRFLEAMADRRERWTATLGEVVDHVTAQSQGAAS